MPNSSAVCCDTNLIVDWAVQRGDFQFRKIIDRWLSERRPMIAPLLQRYEATNVLFRLTRTGALTIEEAELGLHAVLDLPIIPIADAELHIDALVLARRFSLGATYDGHFLAVARREGCELWTADKRLFNAVQPHLNWVHLVAPSQTILE